MHVCAMRIWLPVLACFALIFYIIENVANNSLLHSKVNRSTVTCRIPIAPCDFQKIKFPRKAIIVSESCHFSNGNDKEIC